MANLVLTSSINRVGPIALVASDGPEVVSRMPSKPARENVGACAEGPEACAEGSEACAARASTSAFSLA